MQASWNFYRFDHARYLALRPQLRAATTLADFDALGEDAAGAAIADAVADGSLSLEEARNALVDVLCCVGEPLPVDASFARFLAALGRRKGAEDAAETLGALLSGGHPVEPWLRADDEGLIGLLSVDETRALYEAYAPLLTRRGRSMAAVGKPQGRRIRRGGLVGACAAFFRSLFNTGPEPDELLRLLGLLLHEAVEQKQGLAVIGG